MIACAQSAATKLFCFVTYFETNLILTTLNYGMFQKCLDIQK